LAQPTISDRPQPSPHPQFQRSFDNGARSGTYRFGWICYAIAIGLLLVATLFKGIPAVRHDWLWPADYRAFLNSTIGYTSGWDVTGIGQPSSEVAAYILFIPTFAIGLFFGSTAALAALLSIAGFLIAHAAVRISQRNLLSPQASIALTAFLVANPWVYAEIVAGHVGMLISFACLALLWSEFSGQDADRRTVALAMFGAALQPQFFVLAWLGCATRLRTTAGRAGLLYGAIAFFPCLVALGAHVGSFASTPLTVSWERQQSVPLFEGAMLRGYFAHYTAAFNGPQGTLGIAPFVLLSLLGVAVSRNRRTYALAILTLAVLFSAAGTRGPLATLFRLGFAAFPPLGLYRELYDLIGLAAIAYGLMSALALARFPRLGWAALLAGALLLAEWFVVPPSSLWVSSRAIATSLPAASQGRYVLLPPYQPVMYRGRGSGVDPALAYQSLDVTPLNRYSYRFPESTALAQYLASGDQSGLARLGAAWIVCRAGFEENNDSAAILGESIRAPGRTHCAGQTTRILQPAPILSVQDGSELCSLCSDVGNGDVFFGDLDARIARALQLRAAGTYRRVAPPREESEPSVDWVDARLVIVQKPQIGQAFGGAYTTSERPLNVAWAPFALASVRGTLRDQSGALIARDTSGYAWLPLPAGTSSVRCRGECAIALLGAPGSVPLNAAPLPAKPLEWKPLAPWMVVASLPPNGDRQIIRYLVSYDRWWLAITPAGFLQHLRLDAAINGWIAPARESAQRLVIVHIASVFEIVLEFLGVVAFALVLSSGPRRRVSVPLVKSE
jgi:hypothetical protein